MELQDLKFADQQSTMLTGKTENVVFFLLIFICLQCVSIQWRHRYNRQQKLRTVRFRHKRRSMRDRLSRARSRRAIPLLRLDNCARRSAGHRRLLPHHTNRLLLDEGAQTTRRGEAAARGAQSTTTYARAKHNGRRRRVGIWRLL